MYIYVIPYFLSIFVCRTVCIKKGFELFVTCSCLIYQTFKNAGMSLSQIVSNWNSDTFNFTTNIAIKTVDHILPSQFVR